MFRLEKFYPAGFNPQQYWDDRYAKEHIAGRSSDEFRRQGFWPLLEQQLTPTGRFLDTGAGVGGWTVFLAEEKYNVTGIDIAARTIRAMTEYNPDLQLKVASITQIPYADNTFDGVLAIGVLEYVDGKVPHAFTEVARVLQPGGWFFIEVPAATLLRRLCYFPLKRLEKMLRLAAGRQPSFANYLFSRNDIQQLCTAAGFEVVTMAPHELPNPGSHYGLWIDFPWLRGSQPYQLNVLGRCVKTIANAISPWIASTGIVVVARKKTPPAGG